MEPDVRVRDTLPLEVGLVMAGRLDAADHRAVSAAMRSAQQQLADWFPRFAWALSLHRRPDWALSGNSEPAHWLLQVSDERDANHWDFGVAIVNLDLVGHYRPYAFAAVSRPLDVGVISTLRIDPDQAGVEIAPDERVERIGDRLARLILLTIGHLCGLRADAQADNLMFRVESAGQLDRAYRLSEDQQESMRVHLEEVADVRLEERGNHRQRARWLFYLNAMWINRRDIAASILGARPWEFPLRLSRLTTAAASALAVLLMTAEAWDLGLAQSPLRLTGLGLGALAFTSLYVAHRQQLFVRRSSKVSEQAVTAQVASLGIVALGMATLWLLLAIVSNVASVLLFDLSLITEWAGESDWQQLIDASSSVARYALALRMSVFVASIGILIGALGASFETQEHFRHIVYVDEEV
jgi:hypothetical protein